MLQSKFSRLFDRILRVAARTGESYYLRFGSLRLKQEGSEVAGVQRRAYRADNRAARFLDDISSIALKGVTESIVRRQKEPAVVLTLDHRLARDIGERIGILGPVNSVRRTRRPGKIRRARARHDENSIFLARNMLHSERD